MHPASAFGGPVCIAMHGNVHILKCTCECDMSICCEFVHLHMNADE